MTMFTDAQIKEIYTHLNSWAANNGRGKLGANGLEGEDFVQECLVEFISRRGFWEGYDPEKGTFKSYVWSLAYRSWADKARDAHTQRKAGKDEYGDARCEPIYQYRVSQSPDNILAAIEVIDKVPNKLCSAEAFGSLTWRKLMDVALEYGGNTVRMCERLSGEGYPVTETQVRWLRNRLKKKYVVV